MRWLRYLILLPAVLLLNCVAPPAKDGPVYLYDSIEFDIAYVDTAGPQQRAIDGFRLSLVEQRICDDQGISFSTRPVRRMSSNTLWNVSILQTFETINEGRPSRSSDVRHLDVFVAYVHGLFLPPPTPGKVVCGYTYGNASFAALVDVFDRNTQESALLLHEMGHVIDLPGEDHCPNSECVMYEYVRRDGARFCAGCLEKIDEIRRDR